MDTAAAKSGNEARRVAMKAWIVAEAANLPTCFEADEMFEQKGITVLPDILVNAGSLVTSYLEWMQNQGANTQNNKNPELELCARLGNAYTDVMKRAVKEGFSIKKAAYTFAVEQVAAGIPNALSSS